MEADYLEGLARAIFEGEYGYPNRWSEQPKSVKHQFTDSAKAALAYITKNPPWQDISTAPRDGQRILGIVDGEPEEITWWDGVYCQYWICAFDDECAPVRPTHWMPVPSSPKTKG